MALTWLADELRRAGLTVVEHSSWKTHDRPGSWSPTFGVVHATAAPRSQADSVQVSVVRNGRSDLPGPIANATIDRQGRWHVLSAGRCNSTLAGTAGPYKGKGNTYALSTEACNDNRGEPWPDVQYRSYVRGWAAWCKRLGWPASRLVGHKEHTPGRKTDPTFNMATFRRDVAAVLAGEDDDMPLTSADEKTIQRAVHGMPIGRSGTWLGAVLDDLRPVPARLDAILAAVLGDKDAEQITAEIRAQGEQTRAALTALVGGLAPELAPALAALVADRLGVEIDQREVGEAIAQELAELLGAAAQVRAGSE